MAFSLFYSVAGPQPAAIDSTAVLKTSYSYGHCNGAQFLEGGAPFARLCRA